MSYDNTIDIAPVPSKEPDKTIRSEIGVTTWTRAGNIFLPQGIWCTTCHDLRHSFLYYSDG
jgi:hypothetical protein